MRGSAWLYTPVTSAPRRLRQDCREFQASLNYTTVRPHLKKDTYCNSMGDVTSSACFITPGRRDEGGEETMKAACIASTDTG